VRVRTLGAGGPVVGDEVEVRVPAEAVQLLSGEPS
jgi:hypothetical protein